MSSKPEVITLCGSTRFMEAFIQEMQRLTLEGKIVISVGMFGHQDPTFDMNGDTKKMLDELHLRKIDLADRIHVINPPCRLCEGCGKPLNSPTSGDDCCGSPVYWGSYIGESTRREIAYAMYKGKLITSMEPIGE